MKPCKDCALFRRRRCIVNPVPRKGTTPGCANWRPSQPVCKTCGGQGYTENDDGTAALCADCEVSR